MQGKLGNRTVLGGMESKKERLDEKPKFLGNFEKILKFFDENSIKN